MAREILERLRHRVDIYAKAESKTEFGELSYDYCKIGAVWAEILLTNGKEEDIDGQSIGARVTHKITLRKQAVKEPRNDMYFVFQNQHYEVMYFMPRYRRNDLIEFYCKLILEGDKDYEQQK